MKQHIIQGRTITTQKKLNGILNTAQSYGELILRSCRFSDVNFNLEGITRLRLNHCNLENFEIDANDECGLSFWSSSIRRGTIQNCATRLAVMECTLQSVKFINCPAYALCRLRQSGLYQCALVGIDFNNLLIDDHTFFIGCNPAAPILS